MKQSLTGCNTQKTWFTRNPHNKKAYRHSSLKGVLVIIMLLWACILVLTYGFALSTDNAARLQLPHKPTFYQNRHTLHQQENASINQHTAIIKSSSAKHDGEKLTQKLQGLRMHNVLRTLNSNTPYHDQSKQDLPVKSAEKHIQQGLLNSIKNKSAISSLINTENRSQVESKN